MKRSLAFVLALVSTMALSAAAQAPASTAAAPAGPTKVAVIAFQATVTQTNEFQRNFADLQKKFEPQRQQLKVLSDEIDTLTKQLQSQSATLSEAERASRASVIDAKKAKLDRDTQDAQNDFGQQMQDIFRGVGSKVYAVLEAYAKQHGYTLVLDASEQSPTVLYSIDSVNISKPVLDAYNLKSGIPAPPLQSTMPSAPEPAPAAPGQP
jgi:outer membrane protein